MTDTKDQKEAKELPFDWLRREIAEKDVDDQHSLSVGALHFLLSQHDYYKYEFKLLEKYRSPARIEAIVRRAVELANRPDNPTPDEILAMILEEEK